MNLMYCPNCKCSHYEGKPCPRCGFEDNKVTITKARYAELLEAEGMLTALHAGGVDNWEWYSESLASYFEAQNDG